LSDKITHPNFRIKDQKNIASRGRAVLFTTDQATYDHIMVQVDHGLARDSLEVIQRALDKYFDESKDSKAAE
jgi:hypothetical protein